MKNGNHKIALFLMIIALLSEVSADFVLGSISDKLTIQIQDIQRLIVQEQERADKQETSEQAPSSVTVTQAPDGRKNMTIEASVGLNFEVDLSGEIIRIYRLRIVDLNNAKNAYDLGKRYLDTALETEVIFMFGLSMMWELKRLLGRRPLLQFFSERTFLSEKLLIGHTYLMIL